MVVVSIVSAVCSSVCPSTSLRITALRWVTGSTAKLASAARITAGSGRSSTATELVDVVAQFGELAPVALQEVERGVVRDAKEPGA
jgi:hypothetical protein